MVRAADSQTARGERIGGGLMPMIDFIAGEEHEVTAVVAYRLWEKRGCPLGSPA